MKTIYLIAASILFLCCNHPKCQAQQEPIPMISQVDSFWQSLDQQTTKVAVETFEKRINKAYSDRDTLFIKQLLRKIKDHSRQSDLSELAYHYASGLYLMLTEQYEQGAKMFGETVNLSKKYAINRLLLEASMKQGICLERNNQPTKAYTTFQELEAYLLDKKVLEHKDSLFLFHVGYRLAYKAYLQDNYVKALIRFQDAYQLAEEIRDTFNMSNTLYYIIGLQDYIGEDEARKENETLLLNLLNAQPSEQSKAEALSIKLISATSEEEALGYFEDLKTMYEKGEISNFIRYLYEYASWLEKNISYTAAYPINQKIVAAYDTDCSHRVNYYYSRSSIIQYYLETKQYKKAVQDAHQLLICTKPLNDKEIQANLYQKLSDAYAALQRPDSAYQYLLQANTLRDSMEADKNTEQVMKAYLQNQFKQEKALLALEREKEKVVTAAQIKQQRNLLVSTLIILSLIIGLLFFIYRNYQIQTRTNQQLTDLNQNLERSNQKLDRFVQSVSHDILSNLDLILSTGKVLVGRQGKPEGLQAFYEATIRSVKQTKQYCQNILLAARQPGNQTTTPVDTNQILQSVLAKLSGLIQQYDLRIEYDELPLIPMQTGDLAQIFQNLLHNAISFAGPGGQGKIAIRTITENDHIKIGVLDNGPGIPADQLEAIFEPGVSFRQNGTGTGLATVKAIVESYGGRVWAERNEWGGAGVWFAVES